MELTQRSVPKKERENMIQVLQRQNVQELEGKILFFRVFYEFNCYQLIAGLLGPFEIQYRNSEVY